MADALTVELVAADRTVWSGEATMVIARTTEGELGVLPGHAPLLGQLADVFSIQTVYRVCSFLPALGILTAFLPDIGHDSARS